MYDRNHGYKLFFSKKKNWECLMLTPYAIKKRRHSRHKSCPWVMTCLAVTMKHLKDQINSWLQSKSQNILPGTVSRNKQHMQVTCLSLFKIKIIWHLITTFNYYSLHDTCKYLAIVMQIILNCLDAKSRTLLIRHFMVQRTYLVNERILQ